MLDLDKLSGDTARQILKCLIEQGKVDDQCVQSAMKVSPTAELKRLVDFVHNLFCLVHSTGEAKECPYYREEQEGVHCWESLFHQKWLEKTIKLMEDLQASNESEFQILFGEAKRMQDSLNQFRSTKPRAYRLFAKMNGWEE